MHMGTGGSAGAPEGTGGGVGAGSASASEKTGEQRSQVTYSGSQGQRIRDRV
jgi:hypothetical protein